MAVTDDGESRRLQKDPGNPETYAAKTLTDRVQCRSWIHVVRNWGTASDSLPVLMLTVTSDLIKC